jgi:hypothetical protein
MKAFLAALMLLAHLDLNAFELIVHNMSVDPQYSARQLLRTSYQGRVALDCQSFIQGLFFDSNPAPMVYLDEWECMDLMADMQQSLNRRERHCIEVNAESGVIERQETCPDP